jgi:hypothetical protein
MAHIGDVFGQENLQKISKLLSSNAADAEAKIGKVIRSVTNSLPDFSLSDLKPTKKQVTGAAAVAGGVGAIYLLREYLTRDSGKAFVKAVKKVAGAARNPSSLNLKGSAKSKKTTGGAKAKKKSTAKSSSKSSTKSKSKKAK